MFFEILKASKGLYTDNIFAEMWGKRLAGQEEWQVTEITGYLPLTFLANGDVLKNYRLHGTSEGAGVQTDNLFDKSTTLDNYALDGNSIIKANGWFVSDYIPVKSNTVYTRTNTGQTVHQFDSNYELIQYGNPGFTFTTTSNTAYVKINSTMELKDTYVFVKGSTAPASYIPYGYQIPLTVTSGVTENLWDLNSSWTNTQTDTKTNLQLRITQYNGTTLLSSTSLTVNANGHYTIQTNLTDVNYTSIYLRHNGSIRDLPIGTIYYDFKKDKRYIISLDVLGYDPTIVDGIKLENIMLTEGSIAPDHYIPHRYTADYNLYIGSTKLGAEEYVDYESGKVWKMVDGTLTPTDPPAPFPAITAYEGENTLSSTETVGEVTVRGKIKTAQGG